MQNIPSILNPSKRAYKLIRYGTDAWNQRGSSPFCSNVLAFDTYGDGNVQHSGAWVAQYQDCTDVCISLTTAMLAEPMAECWRWLNLDHYNDNSLRFALSIRWNDKPGKDQFYSLSTLKVTSADKRNDRRFEPVQAWMDGSVSAAFRILCPQHLEWLEKLLLASRIREIAYQRDGSMTQFQDVFPQIDDLSGDWLQALRSLEQALNAVRALNNAERILSCAVNNSTPKTESVVAA